jgi:hypothetical protein
MHSPALAAQNSAIVQLGHMMKIWLRGDGGHCAWFEGAPNFVVISSLKKHQL